MNDNQTPESLNRSVETPISAVAQAQQPESAVPAVPAPSITLDQLVNIAIEQNASDIHFNAGGKIALRVGGKFVFIENVTELSESDAQNMVSEMINDEAELRRLKTVRELDFSYIHATGVSFRVNVYYSRGSLSAVMRMISKHLPTMEELGIPPAIKSFLELKAGLILVTGTTGSGKSTSIQAMLEYVNQNLVYHIITIENPIEHVFKEEKSIFSQRELGKDTLTFTNAIHSATREDPNIVMISEIDDRNTLDAVLNLVETGHLVIAAVPTKNVFQTLEHITSMYPHEEQEILHERFAENLALIMSQDLLDRADQTGQIAVYEILVGNKAVKNIIRHGTLTQLRTAMESGASEGMITMDVYAEQMAERGFISKDDADQYIQEQSV